jgi:NAD(P)H-quinone oxidoreductase subunit 3
VPPRPPPASRVSTDSRDRIAKGDGRLQTVGRECLGHQEADQQPNQDRAPRQPALDERMALTGIWYIIGFAFAAGSFTFLTFGAAWLVSHRNRGDVHKGLPYESGIDTYGDTHGRFGLSFYIYALLFVAFDIEVVFIYLWALIFRDPTADAGSLFISMLVFVAILLFGLAYAWRKGVLSWKGPGEAIGDRRPPSGERPANDA